MESVYVSNVKSSSTYKSRVVTSQSVYMLSSLLNAVRNIYNFSHLYNPISSRTNHRRNCIIVSIEQTVKVTNRVGYRKKLLLLMVVMVLISMVDSQIILSLCSVEGLKKDRDILVYFVRILRSGWKEMICVSQVYNYSSHHLLINSLSVIMGEIEPRAGSVSLAICQPCVVLWKHSDSLDPNNTFMAPVIFIFYSPSSGFE
ncbi:hypothetical protein BDF20DRAFT_839997 [Mycotypha africana]|uniref:uncharacterized protein n=1 Tax=Mycotypha africana TaxID=64632 RepID=UPI002301EC3E|nr:uncharacterized protein BDF20DRAFT_839997 [Mycotypha africana]KAI8967788.1 hypothetical protein BDF20DRAFT_839997 [Mycotypha africana]